MVHVAIDATSRLASVEVLASEQKTKAVGVLVPCHRMGVRARDQLPPGPLRPWLRLPLRGLASNLSGIGSETDSQQGLNASDQQHSGYGSSRHAWRSRPTWSPTRHQKNQPLATSRSGDR